MARRHPRLRDPERTKLLQELADHPHSVTWILRAERCYHIQMLDDDVRASKRVLTIVSVAAPVNMALSLFRPLLGAFGSLLGSGIVLGRMVYERVRPEAQIDRPTVERSLALLGGVQSLPVSFLLLAENVRVPNRPFLVRDSEENAYYVAEKLRAAFESHLAASDLTEAEREILELLKKDGFSGSLDELVETSRNLAG